ncbi:hypothetical protein DFH11DRAFT_1546096 [Phellopilus nigrolimitatus]|nr:hypothetical protein DFH11DRAFT_1546096 [Phellopilus nigrolimitatus]
MAAATAPEVTGLRKRSIAFKPRDTQSASASELRVLHEKGGTDRDDEDEGEAVDYENMTRSFSSASSHSSLSVESEFACVDGGMGGSDREAGVKADYVAEERTPPKANGEAKLTSSSRFDSPHVSPGPLRPTPRFQHRSSRSTGGSHIKQTRGRGSSSGSSWLGYDLSIIVALVSPIGNLLTGSDHIKNILLLLLLIYYLHQLVEVPWTLYRASIPSREPMLNEESTTKHAAHAELRTLELFYLILTVLSPFFGAILLKYVATAISGNTETLSWFSTSLFVLATGVRPWSHLVERLKDRSRALNVLLEEDEEERETTPADNDAELNAELGDLRGRLGTLDTRVSELAATNSRDWDDLADAVDGVEKVLRRHRAESARRTQSDDARLNALEAYVLALQKGTAHTNGQTGYNSTPYLRGMQLRALFWETAALPWSVAAAVWARTYWFLSTLAPGHITPGKRKLVCVPPSGSQPLALETILEEDSLPRGRAADSRSPADESDHTLVGDSPERKRNVAPLVKVAFLRIVAIAFSPVAFALRMAFLLLSLPQMTFRTLFSV